MNQPRDIRYDAIFSLLEQAEKRAAAQLLEQTPWYLAARLKAARLDGITSELRALRNLRNSIEVYRATNPVTG